VDESSLRYAHERETVPVVLDALGSQPVMGNVSQIVPAADPASRTFTVAFVPLRLATVSVTAGYSDEAGAGGGGSVRLAC
jgi:hypothetical protein